MSYLKLVLYFKGIIVNVYSMDKIAPMILYSFKTQMANGTSDKEHRTMKKKRSNLLNYLHSP